MQGPVPLDKMQQSTYTCKKVDTPLKTARCVYWREIISGTKGVSKKSPTLS